MVPRPQIAERIAEVAGAGGVVLIAAEAGTGKRVLARQAMDRLADEEVILHDADRQAADHEQLARLLASRGSGAGAIVVARRDPGACVRATGPVLELDGEDLAWSIGEVAEALERWGAVADPERLVTLTEGWCAAIRLGALVGEHALAPASRPLAEFLFADALRGIPQEHREALLRLSFVDRFDEAEAARIVGGDGAEVLAALTKARMFLRSAGPGVWRVHRLVAAVARRQLTFEDPETARRLRGRRPMSGAEQSATVDVAVTDPLVAAHAWEIFLDGRLSRPSIAALEVARTGTSPTRLAAALALLSVGDARGAGPLLTPRLASEESAGRDPARRLAQLMVARLDGDATGVEEHAEALARLHDVPVALRAMAAIERGILADDLGRFADAERHLLTAAGLADHAARPGVLARARGALALCCVASIRLRASTRHAEAALAQRTAALPDGRVRALLALALGAYLRDDLTAAGDLMIQTRRMATQIRDDALWGRLLVDDAIVAEALGEYDRAQFTLAEARSLAAHPIARTRLALLDVVHARLLDHAGRRGEAARLVASLPDGPETDLVRARAMLAARRPGEAMALLARWVAPLDADPSANAECSAVRTIWHQIALALAAAGVEDHPTSQASLERALDLAAPEQLRRPFAEERARLRPLLEHQAGITKHGAFVEELLARDGRFDHAATADAGLREPLTRRELTVLGYLPSRMTAAEIAGAVGVSEATVRTHMRHIYEKLGANGRYAAVDRARSLNLLA